MKFVCLIRSEARLDRCYVGLTSNIADRLEVHNMRGSVHTAKVRPWKLVAYFVFSSTSKALAFEKYLKTAFARKRLC